MKLSRGRIRAHVKGDLPITFSQERISAHGGLELLRCLLRLRGFAERVRKALGESAVDGDYGVVRMLLAVVALLVVGGLRVTHLAFLGVDPILLRFCDLQRLPADRTVVRWLKTNIAAAGAAGGADSGPGA